MSTPNMEAPGVWRALFPPATALMASLERHIAQPSWTFGGGTVLMLRIGHRQSKDIDLFVPDPQYLLAGEIDIVVGVPLTQRPFDLVPYAGREIKVETCTEIIAKKMWHRGDRAKARDLYDRPG